MVGGHEGHEEKEVIGQVLSGHSGGEEANLHRTRDGGDAPFGIAGPTPGLVMVVSQLPDRRISKNVY